MGGTRRPTRVSCTRSFWCRCVPLGVEFLLVWMWAQLVVLFLGFFFRFVFFFFLGTRTKTFGRLGVLSMKVSVRARRNKKWQHWCLTTILKAKHFAKTMVKSLAPCDVCVDPKQPGTFSFVLVVFIFFEINLSFSNPFSRLVLYLSGCCVCAVKVVWGTMPTRLNSKQKDWN